MPTAESVAIREEVAIERIRQAALTLKARTGVEFNDVDLNVFMAPIERQAVLLEQIADILESLAVILQDPIILDEEDKDQQLRAAPNLSETEEAENGPTDEGKRRPSPRRKT